MHIFTAVCSVNDCYIECSQGGDVVCDGRNDPSDYRDIISAMKVLMYTEEEIWNLHKIVAALLHIGNITYRGMAWYR